MTAIINYDFCAYIIAYYYYLRMCVCMHVMIATFIAIDCWHKLRLLLCAFIH